MAEAQAKTDKATLKLSKQLLKEAKRKQQDMVKIEGLLEQGASATYRDAWNGNTPMAAAMKRWNPQLIRLLVEHGADTETPWKGGTPLMAAAARGEAELAGYLISKGAQHGEKALLSAIRWQHVDTVRAMFDAGVPLVSRFSESGQIKALQVAEQIGNADTIALVQAEAKKQGVL